MKRVGAHVSAAGGVFNAPKNAAAINARAFALFTKNQRQWNAPPYTADTISQFHAEMKRFGFSPEQVLPHDSYLINAGNPDPQKRKRSLDALTDELTRCDQLGLRYLNIHPGSHLREISEIECLKLIAESINTALANTETAAVVLENTAGQGSNVGYRFEHLAEIRDQITDTSRIGVCIDTCHAFAAGFDIRTKKGYDSMMDSLDDTVGLDFLCGMHLNDAKVALGSRKDRHHSLGEGTLGLEPFRYIMNDPRLDEIPLILETIDDSRWEEEIRLLYSFVK